MRLHGTNRTRPICPRFAPAMSALLFGLHPAFLHRFFRPHAYRSFSTRI